MVEYNERVNIIGYGTINKDDIEKGPSRRAAAAQRDGSGRRQNQPGQPNGNNIQTLGSAGTGTGQPRGQGEQQSLLGGMGKAFGQNAGGTQ